jgi:hypothetical protein
MNMLLGSVMDAANVLVGYLKSAPEFCHWFKNAGMQGVVPGSLFMFANINLPSSGQIPLKLRYVLEDWCNEGGKELHTTERQFCNGKYPTESSGLFQNVSGWFNAMGLILSI